MSAATFLADLAADMQTAGFGTMAVDIFVGQMGEDVQNALLVHQYGGSPSDNLRQVAHPLVQVLVRNQGFAGAWDLVNRVYSHFNERESFDVGPTPTHVVDCMAVQPPISLGQDGRERWLAACNLKFTIKP